MIRILELLSNLNAADLMATGLFPNQINPQEWMIPLNKIGILSSQLLQGHPLIGFHVDTIVVVGGVENPALSFRLVDAQRAAGVVFVDPALLS